MFNRKSLWVEGDVSVLYLYVPLIVAAVFVPAALALALVGNLRVGGVVFRRRYRVGGLGNLHRFSVDGIGHSHCKVLLGDAGKYRQPERQMYIRKGHFLLLGQKSVLRWLHLVVHR